MFTIRDATTCDVQDLCILGRGLYRTYFAHLWSEEGFSRFLESQFDERSIHQDISAGQAAHYLIDLGVKTIGFAKTKPAQRMPHSIICGTLLEKLYLFPEYTGLGLGQQVLADLIARAQEGDAELVWLEVLKTNNRARRAYEKAGFSVAAEVPFATDQQEIGFFIMCRTLANRSS